MITLQIKRMLNILLMALLVCGGAVAFVMAEDEAAEAVNTDIAAAEQVDEDTTADENKEAVQAEDETPAEEVTPSEEPADETPAEEVTPSEEPADETPAEEVIPAEEEETVEFVESGDDEQGELGDASSYDPETKETTVHHPDGTTEVFADPEEPADETPELAEPVEAEEEEVVEFAEPADDEQGELGDASSYDPETRETTVHHPDGTTEVFVEPEEEEELVEEVAEEEIDEEEAGEVGDSAYYDPELKVTVIERGDGTVEYIYDEPEEDVTEGVVGPAASARRVEGGWEYTYWNPDGTVETEFVPDEDVDVIEGVLGPASYSEPTSYGERTVITYNATSYQPVEYAAVDEVVPAEEVFEAVEEAEAKEEASEEGELVFESVSAEDDETAVLGAYVDDTRRGLPVSAGIVLLVSTAIAAGVLLKTRAQRS